MVWLKVHRTQRLPHERRSTRSKHARGARDMHAHSIHLHPQRHRRNARNLPAHRKPLAPASKALKMIVLLGVLRGLHDASLGWVKISPFERGDPPAPEHHGAQRSVGRSSRGAWALWVRGQTTHRWPWASRAGNGKGAALVGKVLRLFSCNLDSLSENQLPNGIPEVTEGCLACYASNHAGVMQLP